jgi:hypothetical protein
MTSLKSYYAIKSIVFNHSHVTHVLRHAYRVQTFSGDKNEPELSIKTPASSTPSPRVY